MTLPPLHIGPVTIPFPVLLAPMAGYTDAGFRSLCRRFGAGAVFTEVTTSEGLLRHSPPTLHLLETFPGEPPVAAHIYGSRPESMARAAAVAESLGRFDFIDINAGCPVRKIVSKGAGAALMKDPSKLEAIVRAVCGAVSLPVTVKTRIGTSPAHPNVMDLLAAAENGGARAITIHARFASRQHNGPADWDALAAVKARASIPVIGNGGVNLPGDALALVRHTAVDGVMIGRAAVGDPWVFEDIAALFAGRPPRGHTLGEHRAVLLEHLDAMVRLTAMEPRRRRAKLSPESSAVLHFRGHLVRYLAGFPGFADIRRNFQAMDSRERLLAAIDRVMSDPPSTPVIRPAQGSALSLVNSASAVGHAAEGPCR